MDCPLLQRLRLIHQNGLTYLVYPTCLQTRFDHTIGVTILSEKFIDFLVNKNKYRWLIHDEDKINLKLASLLHDVGHGLFSHASEDIYKEITYFKKMKDDFDDKKKKVQPHEFLSYIIVESKSFKDFIEELNKLYGFKYNLHDISEFIIGKAITNPNKQFLAEILNGTLDVDKLDYMKRDAHFLGFNLPVEIDQIMYRTRIIIKPNYKLSIDIKGIHNVDQLIFNKAFYYSTIYLHHKIRAATCMLKSIFKIIENDPKINVNGLRFDKVSDFLSIGDEELLTYKSSNQNLNEYIQNLRNRNLFKRILEIAPKSIKNYKYQQDMWERFDKALKNNTDLLKGEFIKCLKEIRDSIKDYELWIDIPKNPELSDLLPIVKISKTEDVIYDDIFDATDFFNNYFTSSAKRKIIKLKTYIFGIPDVSFRKKAQDLLQKYIKDNYNLELESSAYSKIVEKPIPLTKLSSFNNITEKDFLELGIECVQDLCEWELESISKLLSKYSEDQIKNWIKEGTELIKNL